MSFRNRHLLLARKPSQNLRLARRCNRIPHHAIVPLTPHAVHNHTRKSQFRIEHLEPHHYSSNTPRTLRCIDNKNHRQPQQLRNLRAATHLRAPTLPIEEPHHALRNHDIRTPRRSPQHASIRLRVHHPRIEIPRRTPAYPRVMPRIQKVRPTFERLHRQPTPSQPRHDRQRNRRLPNATRRARDQQPPHCVTSRCPFSASGSPATISTTSSATRATLWLISPSRSRYRRPSGYAGTTP